jgi:hypothetical protein
MTLLCIKPSGAWWSDIMSAPATGPACGEPCNGVEIDGGYVLDGYGEEPYDKQYFITMQLEKKEEEIKECKIV